MRRLLLITRATALASDNVTLVNMNMRFDLSVIIPTYNEETHLPRLLRQLWQQDKLQLQIIVVDGGSRDNTASILQDQLNLHSGEFICCCTQAHRARQLNLGATLAAADYLLFLHADTVLENNNDLLLSALRRLQAENQHSDCAGHFPLLFNETEGRHPFGFYYYAAKTALNRIDVINGDQGFMLPRQLFTELGGFDDSLSYMEDARLANKILRSKRWVTLPGRVSTSARRFVSEGFSQRQLLNSFLCNFNSIGLNVFFTQAADAYKRQSDSRQLEMRPFLHIIHRIMKEEGFWQALKYWYLTGRYIVNNAWQLAFQRDCRRDFKQHYHAHQVHARILNKYDRWVAPWLMSAPFYAACALLTLIWFYCLFIVYRR